MILSLSIVIPNYNGRQLLEQCIKSAQEAAKYSNLEHEIIVADDASTDESIDFLKEQFPFVQLIESKENKGFATNINKGIFAAKNNLVFLLNSDVELTKEYFISQLKYFEKQDTFGVMGRISGKDGKIQDAAKYPGIKGTQIIATKNFLPDTFNKPVQTLFLSGANALIDRKKLIALRGFDEIYSPFYMEDVDLSLRAQRLGWKCYYEHQSICFHATSTTISTHHKRKKVKIIAKRNKLFLHATHLSGVHLILWQMEVLINFLFRWITGDVSFYSSFFKFAEKYKEVIKSRKNLKELQKKYNSKLSLQDIIIGLRRGIIDYKLKIF